MQIESAEACCSGQAMWIKVVLRAYRAGSTAAVMPCLSHFQEVVSTISRAFTCSVQSLAADSKLRLCHLSPMQAAQRLLCVA